MKERIKEIIEAESLNSSKFADSIGVQRSSISHILSGRNKPSLDIIMKILRQFRTISSEWLLFGTGEMYKFPENHKVLKNEKQANLFDTIQEDEEKEKEGELEEVVEEPTKQDITPELNLPLKEKGQNVSSAETVQNVSKISKKNEDGVDKIVIFFSNRTFKDYSPAE